MIMQLKLNEAATGCFLELPTKRLNGLMMRDLQLYLEFFSLEAHTVNFKNNMTLIAKNSSGQVLFMEENNTFSSDYKLYANTSVFLKYTFALREERWKALLASESTSVMIEDEEFDISCIVAQLQNEERKS